MTDVARTEFPGYAAHTSDAAKKRLAKRYAAERRFRALGFAAVMSAMAALVILLATIFIEGIPAFTQHFALLPVDLTGEDINTEDVGKSSFGALTNRAIDAALPFAEGRSERR